MNDAAAPSTISPRELQRRVAEYWRRADVPTKLLNGDPLGPIFRFTEGPPTANGSPHMGHPAARTLKDVQLRYHRMLGERIVTSMAGWDCHGLPVEVEIEKRHGFRSKRQIEEYGVERFCEECRTGTLAVAKVWEEMSGRMGYWLDYAHPYFTMSPTYIESVWWSLKSFFDRGLLEKGYYVLPYCPRCETPLSSHEVAQGYRETTDPSITVRIPLVDPSHPTRSLLVWTTTPWTFPSNLLIAAHADLPYVVVADPDGQEYVLAEAALPRYYPQGATVVERFPGSALNGRRYRPLYPFAGDAPGRFAITLDAMVDANEGSGLVHIAPSFGPDDQRVGARERVGVFDPLDSRGHFTPQVPLVAGKAFKSADPILVDDLRNRGLLHHATTISHTYPFCWRCSSALIYRAVDSWFIRTSRFVDQLVRNNATITWVPEHLRDGRFGNFLQEAKDWALSRNRYWGTPLPIWTCPEGHPTCIGSFAELVERSGRPLPSGFDPHRVGVDPIRFPCPTCGQEAKREPYTIDGWYDSGCAPFAQYHYPFEPGPFDPEQPLDYICEGLDQTRGWFYTLHVIATGLFQRPAYRACCSTGMVLDESGQKQSKSKGNVLDPLALLDELGGDAVRWTFFTIDFTEPMRLSVPVIQKTGSRTLGTLVNVVEFYRSNASADRLAARTEAPTPTTLLDRWILSRLSETRETVDRSLRSFDPRPGAIAIRGFVDDLSTWYLRRSRPRFWSEENPSDRAAANDTLSFTLLTVARLLAPYTPFTAEYVHHEVLAEPYDAAERSVHAQRWPDPLDVRDRGVEEGMAEVRGWVERARELRQRAQVKARIPLEELLIFGAPSEPLQRLGTEGIDLIAEELNVRRVRWASPDEATQLPSAEWILREEEGAPVAALPRAPTPELRSEGWVRETLRRLQVTRKELGLAFTDPIELALFADDDLASALESHRATLARDLLADPVTVSRDRAPEDAAVRSWEIEGMRLAARVTRSASTA